MHRLPLYILPEPTSPLVASDPTAPEHPLLFLHPGNGSGPLALPAAPGRALFLGSDGLGADRGRALEEGLHGYGSAGLCRAVPGPPHGPVNPRPPRPRRPFPPTRPRTGAGPLPPAGSQSQSAAPPGRGRALTSRCARPCA